MLYFTVPLTHEPPNFNFPDERMGRFWLATLACDPGASRWIGEVEGGQIRDAHELRMTSVVRSTLAVPPVSPQRISLINGHQGDEGLLSLVRHSEALMVNFSSM